jgi:hypothetical protein
MTRSSRVGIGFRPRLLPVLGVLLTAAMLAPTVQAQVTPAYPGGPYIYVPTGQPQASVGPPVAAGWEALGDGIVGNEPAGRAASLAFRSDRSRPEETAQGRPSNLDVRFTAHGWVVVWDRLVPLTGLSRDGSLYVIHPQGNGRVRITLDGRELFRDVLFAGKYEQARTLLEGR